jgi:hypothetical protein
MERASISGPRKPRRTTEQIKAIIAQYETSGLSARDFCNLHQIKGFYLARWLKRYRGNKLPKGFVAVRTPKEPAENQKAILFAEYRGIHFYQPVDPSYLKTLVS